MNNQQLEKKIKQDATKVNRDTGVLLKDSAKRMNRFEEKVDHATGKAKNDITAWAEGGVSDLTEGLDHFSEEAKETMTDTAGTIRKNVGHGMKRYNTEAQRIADEIPGSIGKKAAKYPWVTMSIALALGFLLGSILFKPARPLSE
jgi:gas vesicle protein